MEICALTNIGLIRNKNQDSYLTVYNNNHDLLVLVCDGIGGNKAGEVASYEIVKYFERVFGNHNGFKDDEDVITYFKYHVRVASNHVYDLSLKNEDYEGMGTTISGLVVSSLGNFVINAGDSRVYGLFDRTLLPLTKDHTLVNELIDRHVISEKEALTHPKRHYLTRFLGVYEGLSADVYKIMDRYETFLVCSDGLHGYVEKAVMLRILNDPDTDLAAKGDYLIKAALEAGGYDNITLVLVKKELRHEE